MKLAGLDIEHFGRWEHFSQPFHPSGVTIVYGPNEAGKTTLLRFIRGVLYGFPPEERAESWRRPSGCRRAVLSPSNTRGKRFKSTATAIPTNRG